MSKYQLIDAHARSKAAEEARLTCVAFRNGWQTPRRYRYLLMMYLNILNQRFKDTGYFAQDVSCLDIKLAAYQSRSNQIRTGKFRIEICWGRQQRFPLEAFLNLILQVQVNFCLIRF